MQFLVAIMTSVGMLALVRPSLARKLHTGPELRLGHAQADRHPGDGHPHHHRSQRRARSSSPVRSRTAQPYDETLTIEPGETVEVFDIRGATAYVHPVPRLEP